MGTAGFNIAEAVLKELEKGKPLCSHQITEAIGTSWLGIIRVIYKLVQQGQIEEISFGKNEKLYKLANGEPLAQEEDLIEPYIIDETMARARIKMLRDMKEKLIINWHPILDILLGDYQKTLAYYEALFERNYRDE